MMRMRSLSLMWKAWVSQWTDSKRKVKWSEGWEMKMVEAIAFKMQKDRSCRSWDKRWHGQFFYKLYSTWYNIFLLYTAYGEIEQCLSRWDSMKVREIWNFLLKHTAKSFITKWQDFQKYLKIKPIERVFLLQMSKTWQV